MSPRRSRRDPGGGADPSGAGSASPRSPTAHNAPATRSPSDETPRSAKRSRCSRPPSAANNTIRARCANPAITVEDRVNDINLSRSPSRNPSGATRMHDYPKPALSNYFRHAALAGNLRTLGKGELWVGRGTPTIPGVNAELDRLLDAARRGGDVRPGVDLPHPSRPRVSA